MRLPARATRFVGGRKIFETLLPYALLGFAYFVTACLGLLWAEVNGAGSPVWPAAGVALAGLLLGGMHLWPAVVVATPLATIAMGSDNPVWIHIVLGFGNAIAALISVHVASRLLPIHSRLTRLRDVMHLAIASAIAATAAAIIGVVALSLAHSFDLSRTLQVLRDWWFGDFVGALLVSSLILTFSQPATPALRSTDRLHFAALLIVSAIVCYFVFLDPTSSWPRPWHVFPVLVWAALAFHVRGSALLLVIVAGSATVGATLGTGPFSDVALLSAQNVELSQEFSGFVGLTTLVLAAIADERKGKEALETSEARLRQVLDGARAGFWELRLEDDQNLLQSNNKLILDQKYRKLYGISEDAPVTVDDWRSRVRPEDLPGIEKAIAEAIAGVRDQWEQSFRIQHPEGGERWIRDRVWVKRDANGRIISLGGLNVEATEQKLAEEALRKTSERLDLAIRAHGIGIFDCCLKTNRMILSPQQECILGLKSGEFEGHCSDFFRRLRPEYAAALQEQISSAIDEGQELLCFQFSIERPDGTIRDVEGAGRILYDADGRAERVIATSIDVTERKQAERSQRESEKRLQLAYDTAGIAAWDLNLQTDTSVWSPKLFDMLGLDRDEQASSKLFFEHVHPDDLDRVRDGFAVSIASRTLFNEEFRIRRSDGEIRYLVGLGRITEEINGQPIRMLGVNYDITGRKRAEEQLRESEARLQLAIRGADLGTWDLDLASDKATRSLRHDQIFGYDALQPEWGVAIAERHVIDEDKPLLRDAMKRGRETGQHHFQLRVRWPDQSIHWIEALGRTTYNDQGTPIRMAGIVADITGRKRAEETIKLLMSEVNHRSKNLLAVVRAIASETANDEPSKAFAARLNERLRGLAASNDLLVKSAWQHVDVRELVVAQLGPFVDLSGDRVHVTGPDLKLTPAAGQTLGMAMHELATNAAKYGALSNDTGQVSLKWSVAPGREGAVFRVEWRETGGPPVAPPDRRGFGTTVIVDAVEAALGAEVGIEHLASGVRWKVTVPMHLISGGDPLRPSKDADLVLHG